MPFHPFKTISLTVVLFFCYVSCLLAQTNFSRRDIVRRNPAIGLHYGISNFSHSPFEINKINHGYALSFLDGLGGKYDYMIQAGSISPKHPLGKTLNDGNNLLHFINIYGIRRFFADTVLFNPFAGAGSGVSLYNTQFIPNLQAATGFQLRISSTIFLHTQLNYQVNFSSAVNNNLSASIGLLGTILQRKKKNRTVVSHPTSLTQQLIADIDRDGIPDSLDACPTLAGPATFKGCPDTDGDGIADNNDQCPTTPGLAAYHGCPPPNVDPPPASMRIDTLKTNDSISTVINELAQSIYFETNKATLTPASTGVLSKIVDLLKTQHFKQLQIEGHTDNTGTTKRNDQLSHERAQTVLEYLAAAGIDQNKLIARGFGASRPVAPNTTPDGRARNRRTVFILIGN